MILCVVFGGLFLVAGVGEASAYRISGSNYDSRSLSTSESGTSEADA